MMSEHLLMHPTEAAGMQPPALELRLFQGETLVGAYALVGTGLTIGKAATNAIVIQAEYVSRNHARVFAERGRWLVEDVGSTNGTFAYQSEQLVYSSTIDPTPWPLSDGQEIRLSPQPTGWRLLFHDPVSTSRSPAIFIDEKQRQVWIRGRLVKLPRDHYTVLLHLYREAPYPCSYAALCDAIERDRKEREKTSSVQRSEHNLVALHQLIHRLRHRIELDPQHPALLIQVPQFGYRLRTQG